MIYDNAAVASLYSTLAGVLAGFAIAGIVFVVTERTQGRARDQPDDVLALLLAAMLGLTLSSLAYAYMGGGAPEGPQLAVQHVVAGLAFGAASLSFLLALSFLIEATAPSLEGWLRWIVGRATPLVILMFIGQGTLDAVARASGPATAALIAFFVGMGVQVFAVAVTLRKRPGTRGVSAARRTATTSVAVAFVASTGVTLVGGLVSGGEGTPVWPAWVAFLCASVGAAAFTVTFGARAIGTEPV